MNERSVTPILVASLLLLVGCDGRPAVGQAMAQCKLDIRAKAPVWDETFLQTCMESKGFVRDDRLAYSKNAQCSTILTAASASECYRPDGFLSRFFGF